MTRFKFVMPASNALATKPKSTQMESWTARDATRVYRCGAGADFGKHSTRR